MKLLVVTPYFYPKIGGLENYAYNLCIGLKKKYKWDIVVVTSNHKEKKNITETINGLKVYRLAPWFKFSNTPINPLWFFAIKKIIKKEKPNIINAHTPVPFIADLAALTAGNIPFFVTYHAFSLYKYNNALFNLLINLYKKVENVLFKKANKIIVVSDVIKNSIPKRFSKKIEVIYNAISINEIPKVKKSRKQKQENIVFIGSLDKSHEWKGLDEVLLAIKLYCDKTKKDINLFIIGDGDNKSNYQKLVIEYGITKQVKFFGRKEGEEKNKILEEATLAIIYPKSSNDAFPTVALEYWAHSLPIIAANIMPINKIFRDGQIAYLVNPNDPAALVKALEDVINNNILAEKIAQGGYKELRTKYVLENEIKKFHILTKGYTG